MWNMVYLYKIDLFVNKQQRFYYLLTFYRYPLSTKTLRNFDTSASGSGCKGDRVGPP